jgi:hypothetical protein
MTEIENFQKLRTSTNFPAKNTRTHVLRSFYRNSQQSTASTAPSHRLCPFKTLYIPLYYGWASCTIKLKENTKIDPKWKGRSPRFVESWCARTLMVEKKNKTILPCGSGFILLLWLELWITSQDSRCTHSCFLMWICSRGMLLLVNLEYLLPPAQFIWDPWIWWVDQGCTFVLSTMY